MYDLLFHNFVHVSATISQTAQLISIKRHNNTLCSKMNVLTLQQKVYVF